MQRLDLTGKRFGYLTAIEYVKPGKWRCVCDCGNETLVITDNLTRSHTSSCGCKTGDMIKQSKIKHGHTTYRDANSKVYNAWSHMKGRCNNPNNKRFPLYGGRGIKVCPEWDQSFENFLSDMGEPPSPKHSLDRINVDGNYEPGNCRWATQKEQTNNQRRNQTFIYEGETHSLKEWCEIKNAPYSKVRQRINKLGWSFEKSITTP